MSNIVSGINSINDYYRAAQEFEQKKRLREAEIQQAQFKATPEGMAGSVPASLQVFNKLQELQRSGDRDGFNQLWGLARSGAYGVDTASAINSFGQMPRPTQPAEQLPWKQPQGNLPTQNIDNVQPMPNESFRIASEPMPPDLQDNSIAAQMARNAARKKGMEADAANASDLRFKPDISYKVEDAKQRAELSGVAPKKFEEKRVETEIAAGEAAPIIQNLIELNRGTIDAPYAAAFQPFLKIGGSDKAKALDLMKQARLELAAPLAKQLGVNPTDKDFQASLDTIFDVNATQDSREAQIKALGTRLKQKQSLYSKSEREFNAVKNKNKPVDFSEYFR